MLETERFHWCWRWVGFTDAGDRGFASAGKKLTDRGDVFDISQKLICLAIMTSAMKIHCFRYGN